MSTESVTGEQRPPWSLGKLRRLGESIRDGVTPPTTCPDYAEVMLWYNDLAAGVQTRIQGLDWESLLQGRSFEVTSRPKTIGTLREKLQRDPNTPLASVQDIAGVRFEATMTLDEQDAVAWAIASMYGQPEAIHDIRKEPHSGYRAVHVRLRLPARVEIQVRTHIQGHWANTYETLADVLGRGIRYGEVPQEPRAAALVAALKQLSIGPGADLERGLNDIAKLRMSAHEARSRVPELTPDDAGATAEQARLHGELSRETATAISLLATLSERTEQSSAVYSRTLLQLRQLFEAISQKAVN